MDCINCCKCESFTSHSWRYQCTSCLCPNYRHKSFVQMKMKENRCIVNWIDGIASTSFANLDDYKSAMGMARSRNLVWLPIGLKEDKIDEFVENYQTQLAPLDECNTNNTHLQRAMRIASQIPFSDCSINIVNKDSEKIDVDSISESEYNYKHKRDSLSLGFGQLGDVDCNEACSNCQRRYVTSDQFCIRTTHSDTMSWHISCFKCFQCQKPLVDFHYYRHDDNHIYCMRHYDDLNANRCGGCDELIFQKNFTKAMEKDYHVEHFVCIDCDQTLTGGTFVVKDNGPLCLNCYEIKYASVCDRCSNKISCDAKDLFFNNRHWHATCFFCDNCKETLVDKTFATKEKQLYCPNCFDKNFAIRCAGCSEPFQSGVKKFEFSGMQWHEECFRCFDCKQTIGSKSFIPKDGQTLCVQCYENKYAQRCSKCSEVIRKGGVTYKGEPWHRECFLCTECNKELANSKFTSKDEKPYCADCYSGLFSKHCKKCTKIISGFGGCKFISLEEDSWHTECFTCSGCDGNLVGKGFVTHDSMIMCPPCGKQLTNQV